MLTQCTKESKVFGNDGEVYKDLSSRRNSRRTIQNESQDFEGIATKKCLSFRPPRTITTDQLSWHEQYISQNRDNKQENSETEFQSIRFDETFQDTVASSNQSPDSTQNHRDKNSLRMHRLTKEKHRSQQKELLISRGDENFVEYKGTGKIKHVGNSSSQNRQPFGIHNGKQQQVEHEQNSKVNGVRDNEQQIPTINHGQNQNNLLSMPTPKDRSHRQRKKAAHEQKRIHTYWGEQEPAGLRGQEASAEKDEVESPYLQLNEQGLALRLFESSPTRPMRKSQSGISISEISTSTDEHIRLLVNDLPSPNRREGVSGTCLVATDRTVNSASSSSTNSSETLQSMRTDFLEDCQTFTTSKYEDSTLSLREMSDTAQKHVNLGEFDSAIALYKRILVLYRKRYGELHPRVAAVYHNLGMVHLKRVDLWKDNKLQQIHVRHTALVCFQAAARTARESLGKEDPNVAISLVKIGFLHLCSKQYRTALITFREALRIRQVNFRGNPHPLIANLHNNLGICLTHLQHFENANKQFSKALQMQRFILHRESSKYKREKLREQLLEVADTLTNLGALALECLRQNVSQTDIESISDTQLAEAIEIRSSILGRDHTLSIQVISLREKIRTMSSSDANRTAQAFADTIEENIPRGKETQENHLKTSHKRIATPENLPNRPSVDAPPDNACIEDLHDGRAVDLNQVKTFFDEESVSIVDTRDIQPIRASDSVCSEFLDQVFNSLAETLPLRTSVGKEDILSLSSLPNERKAPEKNNIFVKQHNIPRHSPPRTKSLKLRDSPSKGSNNIDNFGFLHADDIMAYNYGAEECCMISGRGEWADFMAPSQLQCSNKHIKDQEVNVLPHEIMIIRPKTDSSRCIGESMPSTGEGNHGFLKQEGTAAYSDEEDGNSIGIAPLSRLASDTRTQSMKLARTMLDNPELHLPEIHDFASMCLKSNRLPEAQELFMIIFDCQRKLVGELHEDVGAALHNVGLAYLRSADHIQALGYFERAVRIRKGTLGKEHLDVAVSLVKVGITLLLMRNFDLSLQAFLDALYIRTNTLGALHLSNACIYINLGCIHVEFKELRDAKFAFESALDIQRNALFLDPTSGHILLGAATTLCNLGFLYRCRKMNQKVAVVLGEALDLQMCVLGDNHPTVLKTMENLADALSLSKVFSQGLWNYSYILSKLNEAEGAENTVLTKAIILYKMAKVHRNENDIEAELEKLQRAQKAAKAFRANSDIEESTKKELALKIRIAIQYSRLELVGTL